MKKFTRTFFAILLMLTMILSSAGTAAIATGVPPITGGEIISNNYNELGIRSVVTAYFNQREAYLLGDTTTIENINPGILIDEATHLIVITNSDIERLSVDIAIHSVACYDSHAEAIVTETITFCKDGLAQTETIEHTMQLGLLDDGTILVVSDGYFESTTGFKSCSYVPSDIASATIMSSAAEGGASCLITVAKNEEGYVEESGNITKYGDTSGGGWCIAFIVWCARQANIPASTIPQTYSPYTMRNYFVESGRYYTRDSGYVPQPGDIYFGSEYGSATDHGGIVYAVDSEFIYTVDGNWGDMVQLRTISRADTYIMGYGNPDYESSGHYYSEYFLLNDTHHRVSCVHCGSSKIESHTMSFDYHSNDSIHWTGCPCGKYDTQGTHTFVWRMNASTHWKECSVCMRTTSPVAHLFVYDNNLGYDVCRSCGMQKGIHLLNKRFNMETLVS